MSPWLPSNWSPSLSGRQIGRIARRNSTGDWRKTAQTYTQAKYLCVFQKICRINNLHLQQGDVCAFEPRSPVLLRDWPVDDVGDPPHHLALLARLGDVVAAKEDLGKEVEKEDLIGSVFLYTRVKMQ